MQQRRRAVGFSLAEAFLVLLDGFAPNTPRLAAKPSANHRSSIGSGLTTECTEKAYREWTRDPLASALLFRTHASV